MYSIGLLAGILVANLWVVAVYLSLLSIPAEAVAPALFTSLGCQFALEIALSCWTVALQTRGCPLSACCSRGNKPSSLSGIDGLPLWAVFKRRFRNFAAVFWQTQLWTL